MINIRKKILCQALDSVASATLIVGRDGAILYANAALERCTGWDGAEVCGRQLADLATGPGLPEPGELPPGECRPADLAWQCRDGSHCAIAFHVVPLYDRPGVQDSWLLTQVPNGQAGEVQQGSSEVTGIWSDTRRMTQRADRMDAATGLPNRRAFEELLRRDWGHARRAQRRLSLILFRVDAFDAYRDLFGRHAADASLRKVGHAISGSLRRDGDLAARYDADSFAVLIGSATEQQASDLADRIAAKVRSLAIHHPRSSAARFVTVRFAVVSEVPPWSESSARLLDQVEGALAAVQETSPAEDARAAG
jgi:diguanylate cyclase (GGDEF)-like protein/PAS domain S-box-containing protein